MTLIAGCYSRSGLFDSNAPLETLRQFSFTASPDREPYRILCHQSGNACLLGKFKADSPERVYSFKVNQYDVLLLGFCTLPGGMTIPTAPGHPVPALALADSPAKILEQSDGEFLAAFLDREQDRIEILNDRFASRPLYILRQQGAVMFSSNLAFLLRLAGKRKRFDPLGWLQIFTYGCTIGSRTNYAGIERLLPATRVVVSADGVSQIRYWKLKHDVDPDLDPAVHADKTFEALREATEARCRQADRGFIALSGGLDSRLVAGCVPKNIGYSAFTFVNATASIDTLEVRTAREVAKILGLSHKVKMIPLDELSSVADDLVILGGGLVSFEHSVKVYQFIREMAEAGGFMLGGGPAQLSGEWVKSIHDLDPALCDHMVDVYCRAAKLFPLRILSRIFKRDLLAHFSRLLDESMAESFTQVSGPTAAHRITAWSMTVRQPAFTFTSPIRNHPDVTEANPHLGYRYAELMLRLPAEWLYQKNFYKYMIYRCLPELKGVVYANTGEFLTGNIEKFIIPRQSLRALSRDLLIRKFPRAMEVYASLRSRSCAPSFPHSLMRSDEKYLFEVGEILRSVSPLKELFNVSSCARFVEDFRAGRIWTDSPATDASLMGSLGTACYCFKNL